MVFRGADKGHISHTWQILVREGKFEEQSRQTVICAAVSQHDRARCLQRPGRSLGDAEEEVRDESAAGAVIRGL